MLLFFLTEFFWILLSLVRPLWFRSFLLLIIASLSKQLKNITTFIQGAFEKARCYICGWRWVWPRKRIVVPYFLATSNPSCCCLIQMGVAGSEVRAAGRNGSIMRIIIASWTCPAWPLLCFVYATKKNFPQSLQQQYQPTRGRDILFSWLSHHSVFNCLCKARVHRNRRLQ